MARHTTVNAHACIHQQMRGAPGARSSAAIAGNLNIDTWQQPQRFTAPFVVYLPSELVGAAPVWIALQV